MDKWKGKVAVVTGASCGIGATVAKVLVKHGMNADRHYDKHHVKWIAEALYAHAKDVYYKLLRFLFSAGVVGLARRKERIDELAAELTCEAGRLFSFRADLTKEEDILNAFKFVKNTVGPVSVLINNAGIIQKTNLYDGETEKWRNIMDTNVLGVAIASREAISIMNENEIDGYIININSIAGHVVLDLPGMNLYSASKHALTAMTETLRFELARLKSNIRVTSLSPGGVNTEIALTNDLIPKEMYDKMLEAKTMQLLESDDVADAVLYLLSTPLRVQVTELIIRPIREKNQMPEL